MKSFQGKVALISGASSGIGLALAKALAARGAVVAIGGSSPDKLAAAKAELDAAGAKSMTVRFDVTDEQAWRDAAEEVTGALGPIAFLGLNAGLGSVGPIATTSSTAWNESWDINVMGVLHGVQACLPAMLASGAEGQVLITSSVAGALRSPGTGPYGVTKAAVLALGENLSAELKDTAVAVSVLIPGPVRTPFAATSARHATQAEDPKIQAMMKDALEKFGMDADVLAAHALDRVQAGALYIFSHSGMGDALAARGAALAAASDIAATTMPQGFGPPPK